METPKTVSILQRPLLGKMVAEENSGRLLIAQWNTSFALPGALHSLYLPLVVKGWVVSKEKKMMIKFNVSYCKGSTPIEVESQEGGKRAGLSFQLGVACDAQALHLVGWVVMLANEIISRFMS